MGKCSRAKQMKTTILMGQIESRIQKWMKGSRPQARFRLWVVAAASLAVALVFSACENVATYTQPSLVRVIDASYIAPAINVLVEGELLASNLGQGTITPYGTVPANIAAPIDITAATGGATIVTTSGTLLPGHQHSVFLTDKARAQRHTWSRSSRISRLRPRRDLSAFRFLNQAAKTGAVDVYMVPAGTTLANSIPIVTDLPVGAIRRLHQLHLADRDHGRYSHRRHHAGVRVHSDDSDRRRGAHRTAHGYQLTSNPAVQVTVAVDAGPSD